MLSPASDIPCNEWKSIWLVNLLMCTTTATTATPSSVAITAGRPTTFGITGLQSRDSSGDVTISTTTLCITTSVLIEIIHIVFFNHFPTSRESERALQIEHFQQSVHIQSCDSGCMVLTPPDIQLFADGLWFLSLRLFLKHSIFCWREPSLTFTTPGRSSWFSSPTVASA